MKNLFGGKLQFDGKEVPVVRESDMILNSIARKSVAANWKDVAVTAPAGWENFDKDVMIAQLDEMRIKLHAVSHREEMVGNECMRAITAYKAIHGEVPLILVCENFRDGFTAVYNQLTREEVCRYRWKYSISDNEFLPTAKDIANLSLEFRAFDNITTKGFKS